MGADLYIDSEMKKAQKEHESVFDELVKQRDRATDVGVKSIIQNAIEKALDDLYPPQAYFRDSYNSQNVLWTINLSWWTNISPMCDDKGRLSVTGCKKFLLFIEGTPHVMPTRKKLVEMGADFSQEKTLGDWHEHFRNKRQELIDFLKHAIELNESIQCSL